MVRGRGRTAAVWAAALATGVAVPGPANAAGEPVPYVFEHGARTVQGGTTPSQAAELEVGTPYRSSLGAGERLVYRVDLDARSSAYVSAVAVPAPGTRVTGADGIKVTLQSDDGVRCGSDGEKVGAARQARPLAATADRIIERGDAACDMAGTYDVVIERTGASTVAADGWDLELNVHEEPPLAGSAGRTPRQADVQPPEMPETQPRSIRGGAGFSAAATVGAGVWQDRIAPGETRFYRVPLGWGQQVGAQAELGGATASGRGGLALSLASPVRARAGATSVSPASGKPAVALAPVPRVDFANRFSSRPEVAALRFPGQYYLQVTAGAELRAASGEDLELTLRVGVRGKAADAPVYAGDPGIFQVDPADGKAAGAASAVGGGGSNDSMKAVAAAGLGSGTLLVLGLGVWTLVARRRAAA